MDFIFEKEHRYFKTIYTCMYVPDTVRIFEDFTTSQDYDKLLRNESEGTIVDLIKEPDNKHDMNAIRVEINGETVGYVANSRYRLIKQVKSAIEIKDTKSSQAEVQFILFGKWVIAKLI